MHFKRSVIGLFALVTIVGVALLAGCSKNESSTGPTTPTGDLPQATATAVAVGTAEGINGIIGSVPTWATGSLGGGIGGFGGAPAPVPGADALGDTAVYDTGTQAWVLRDTTVVPSGADTVRIYSNLSAQLLTGTTPHEDRSVWDHLHPVLALHILSHTRTDSITTVDAVNDYTFDIMVTPGPPGPYAAHGAGHSSGTYTVTYAGTPITTTIPQYTYAIDLTGITEGNCSTGTVTVTIGSYLLTATYNGTGTVNWVMTKSSSQVDTGSFGCSTAD